MWTLSYLQIEHFSHSKCGPSREIQYFVVADPFGAWVGPQHPQVPGIDIRCSRGQPWTSFRARHGLCCPQVWYWTQTQGLAHALSKAVWKPLALFTISNLQAVHVQVSWTLWQVENCILRALSSDSFSILEASLLRAKGRFMPTL